MLIKQLNPPLPIYILDKGKGYAHFLIDYGIEDHLYWVIFMDSTGECWTVANPQIRMQNNPTLGRTGEVESQRKKFILGGVEEMELNKEKIKDTPFGCTLV